MGNGAIESDAVTEASVAKVQQLNVMAQERGQSVAQMALAWILKDHRISSVLIGVSKPEQVTDSIQCLANYNFSKEELERIEKYHWRTHRLQ